VKVLCTGGAGYVGSACLRYLLREGHDAYAYDSLRDGNRGAVPGADKRLIVGDLLDREMLKKTFAEHKFDAVMHFAAVASVPDSIADPADYWEVNVVGTKNVLDAMREAKVNNLVFSSTAATYAFTDVMPITEASVQQPETPYGTTKLACEQMIEEYRNAYGLGYTIMRYFNASGADEDGEFGEDRKKESHLIPLALYAAVGRRDSMKVFGDEWPTRDGTCVRDYVHVNDIAQAHVLAMKSQKDSVGRKYNIGSNTGVTVLEVIKACEKVGGNKIKYDFAPARPGDPATLVASCDKLKADLGWDPKLEGIDAIAETAHRWHARYPQGYTDKNKS
jgi:UDP-glucose 4-epimerase